MENLDFIQKYLKDNKPTYLKVLHEIEERVDGFFQTQEGSKSIHRVITRETYSGSDMKSAEKILEKIKERNKEDSEYSLKNVEDIIGIRIICVHPSDVEIVRQYVQSLLNEKGSKFSEAREQLRQIEIKIGEENIKTGYYAWHVGMRMRESKQVKSI